MSIDKKVVFSLLGGFVLGRAGGMIFGSDKAKEYYLKAATLGLLLKDYTMEQVEIIQAEASDILDEAKAEVEKYQAEQNAAFEASQENKPVEIDLSDIEDIVEA